jgi:hypothetical protein
MTIRRTLAPCILALVWPWPATAQPVVRTFEQLAATVAVGDTLEVTDVDGRLVTGRLLQATPEALTLEVEGRPRTWETADVHLVRHQWRDSLRNGAVLGAVSGAFAGGMVVLARCLTDNDLGSFQFDTCEGYGAEFAIGAGLGAGGGAALGALLDLWRPERRIVFEGEGRAVAVRPVVSPAMRGVLVSVTF